MMEDPIDPMHYILMYALPNDEEGMRCRLLHISFVDRSPVVPYDGFVSGDRQSNL
ncbi:hypothetical protein Hanom_Chr10g00957191 [Helianthus anomalus]